MKKERFEAITDAILAIIITLMVLEIKLPHLTLANLPLVGQHLLIYAISFVYIAILWLNHHHIFARAHAIDLRLVWLNFGLLFLTSLLPLATQHVSEDFHEPANHLFFGLVIGTTTLVYTLLQRLVMRQVGEPSAPKINRRNWLATSVLLASIPLCFISVYLSGAIFLAVPLMYFLVSSKLID